MLTFLSAAGSQSTFSESINNLSTYAGQTVIFRWRDVSDGDFAAYGTSVDNVTLEEIPAGPVVLISPSSKNFGSVISGNSSAPQNFTISNTGAGTLTINTGGITLTGTNSNQFSLGTITYPINLNNGESTVITATFSPTSAGSKSANIQIVHNAPDSPSLVALTGQGLAAGSLLEDFAGTTFPPNGWLAINRDGGTQNWLRSISKFNSAPASANSQWESTTLRNDDWLITPKLSVVTGDALSFYISSSGTFYTEELVVKVGITNDPNGSWTNLDSILTSRPGMGS